MKDSLVFILFVASLNLVRIPASAQQALALGDMVPNISVQKVLNHQSQFSSFSDLKNKITIVDFFGTWCAPCLRALPHLNEIKNTFKQEVSVVLVSNETEEQLLRFISKRQNFMFPVIVDQTNQWNTLFQPPSLPYTVVIKGDKIIAVTEADKITKAAIQGWLQSSVPNPANLLTPETKPAPMISNKQSGNATVRLSQDFIYAAKTGEHTAQLLAQMNSWSYQDLLKGLSTDSEKKAFWINVYNGYTQAALMLNPELYKNRNAFFSKKNIKVGGQVFSLDDIEHGILRHSKIKWSLGLLNKLLPKKREKELRVDNLDYRIHFALNCGAKSCPPIAFYNDETLDTQLDLATKAYLTSEADYDTTANIIRLPKLMSWFRADFGGKKGMRKILRKYNIIKGDKSPSIKFNDYDWSLTLNNYSNQNS